MKYLLPLLFLICFPVISHAYGYKTISCSCGSSMAEKNVQGIVTLTNTGGMNIFYLASSGEQIVQNLYANVTKDIRIPVRTDVSGNYSVDVSTNYNANFDLACNGCDNSAMPDDARQGISFVVGALVGMGFVAASGIRF